MSEFLFEYGLFLAKALTAVVAFGVVIAIAFALGGQSKKDQKPGRIRVTKLNKQLDELKDSIRAAVWHEEQIKQAEKQEKEKLKQEKKEKKSAAKLAAKTRGDGVTYFDDESDKHRVYVLSFNGDVRASAVENLRREISATLTMARKGDEVVVRLESPGGVVHSYGLAASQLDRIKKQGIDLTVCVDRVAASGGYMMACVANKILAAPFAVLGSIGVVAQIPNVHRLLKKHDIDYELMTAGEYKRTLTVFGENTEKGRQKAQADLEDIHVLFKTFVAEHRPSLDIESVATGEIWFGTQAAEKKLVDEIATSDEYLIECCKKSDVYLVSFQKKKSLPEKLGFGVENALERSFYKVWTRMLSDRYLA